MALVASAVCGSAFGQTAVLYRPNLEIKDQGIKVRAWGSGTISETDEVAYEGSHSIRVSTRNFFQGGLINFGNPVDVSKDFASKANLLRVMYRVADASVMSGSGTKGGAGVPGGGPAGVGGGPAGVGGGPAGVGGGPAGVGGAGKQGGGFPGGVPGGPGGAKGGSKGGAFGGGAPGGVPGGPGGFGQGGRGPGPGGIKGGGEFGGGGSSASATPVLRSMRLIITTTDGKKSEVYVPADTSGSADHGWSIASIPLQAITGLDLTNKTIKSVCFTGNTTATFYVGDLRIVNDTTPIRGETNIQGPMNVALGDEYTFTAHGFGGSSILKYTWDFDDKDGIQADAEGQSVLRRFRKPGNYVITCTIADYYGLKQPYTTSFKVTVNP